MVAPTLLRGGRHASSQARQQREASITSINLIASKGVPFRIHLCLMRSRSQHRRVKTEGWQLLRCFMAILVCEVAVASLLVATVFSGNVDLLLANVLISDVAAALFLALLMVRRLGCGGGGADWWKETGGGSGAGGGAMTRVRIDMPILTASSSGHLGGLVHYQASHQRLLAPRAALPRPLSRQLAPHRRRRLPVRSRQTTTATPLLLTTPLPRRVLTPAFAPRLVHSFLQTVEGAGPSEE